MTNFNSIPASAEDFGTLTPNETAQEDALSNGRNPLLAYNGLGLPDVEDALKRTGETKHLIIHAARLAGYAPSEVKS